ncbi:MAG: hypothetical protein AB1Z19_01990 [Eubacteriales bacterium]
MKKTISLMLTLLVVFSLTACVAPLTSTDSDTLTRAQENEGDEQVYETEDEQESEEDFISVAVETTEYTTEEITIIDDENCKMIINGFDPEGYWGFEVSTFLENKTDKTLMFSLEDVSVNGYMIDPYWACELSAGKTENATIDFSPEGFEQCNITTADEICFTLRVFDSNDWTADNIVEETYTIYTTGLDADSIVVPERTIVDGEQVVVDNDSFSFIIQSVEVDDFWGYTLNCFIENKTDMTLMLAWDDVAVNRHKINPFWAAEVAPGKMKYTQISFSLEELAKNGIIKVKEIEYLLYVFDTTIWTEGYIYDEVLTYQP